MKSEYKARNVFLEVASFIQINKTNKQIRTSDENSTFLDHHGCVYLCAGRHLDCFAKPEVARDSNTDGLFEKK